MQKYAFSYETILGGGFGTKASPFLYGIFFAIRMAKVQVFGRGYELPQFLWRDVNGNLLVHAVDGQCAVELHVVLTKCKANRSDYG